jgi:arginase
MMAHDAVVHGPIVIVGVPTALGGHLAGMETTPRGLRTAGLVAALRARKGLLTADLVDAGDLAIDPGFRPDPDPRAKNRAAIAEFLPRERDLVAASLQELADLERPARLLVLGGDCTAHAGALAGLRRQHPEGRLAVAWFDAHGDFNTPDTTPSGNVWGMPFAMICGRGDADLVAAADGPTVAEEDAILLGGQVLDEVESRMLAASRVTHLGAGSLGTDGGQAALRGWAEAVASRVAGVYIAVDMDCLDASGGWAVTMPEPDGLSLETATASIGALAAAMPVVGFGATAVDLAKGDVARTVEAVAVLCEAALGEPRV